MDYFEINQFSFYTWVFIPLLIFIARVMDVSIGTMRIMFLSRNQKILAPVLGFFEVLIWLLAIREVFANLNNPASYLGYALGFATGNFVGMLIEERLAIGTLMVRIVTREDSLDLLESLRINNFGVTHIDAIGSTGPVKIIFTVIKRKNLNTVLEMIAKFNPRAFYTLEDTKTASAGVFPGKRPVARKVLFFNRFRRQRKGK